MGLIAQADVVTALGGCPLSVAESSALTAALAALEEDVISVTGPLGESGVSTFRPEVMLREFRCPADLTAVTVEVDGEPATVDWFASSGVVRLVSCVEPGQEVEATWTRGEPVPARVKQLIASKAAAAIRAARTASAVAAANPDGKQSLTIGSTTVTYPTGATSRDEWIAVAGAGFMTLSADDRKNLRRWCGRQVTTATVR